MMLRGDFFMTVIDALQQGHSVEVVGERGIGRSHFMQRVSSHFDTLGWRFVEIAGVQSSQHTGLAALDIAGISGGMDGRRSSIAAAHQVLLERLRPDPAVILVDDADWVDDPSWSVLKSASNKLRIPILFTRSLHETVHGAAAQRSGSFSTAYTFVLEPMSYGELETALEAIFEVKIDPLTMSRIFAKTGGNIGIARAIVYAGRRSGTLEVDQGVMRATGSLWTQMLNGTAATFLQQLSPGETSAMRTLALLGTADLHTAALLVPREQIMQLEERSFVSLIETSSGVTVTVRPALLSEYFTHESTAGQRLEVTNRIENELSREQKTISAPMHPGIEDPALFVRLAHEKSRLNTLWAREAWRKQPTLSVAAELLRCLRADSSQSTEEIASLIAAAEKTSGSESGHIAWEIEYALYRANYLQEAAAAVTRLTESAQRYPSGSVQLLAQAFMLGARIAPLPENEPFRELDLGRLPVEARLAVVVARSYWLLVSGRVPAADKLLNEHLDEGAPDPRMVGLMVYSKLALDQYAMATHLAETHLARAISDHDAAEIQIYAYLSGVVGTLTHRFDGLERVLEIVAPLGVPAGETPVAFGGLAILNALVALRRGQISEVDQLAAGLDSCGYGEGSLPGMQRSFVYARLEAKAGNPSAAARICAESGDALWAHGARLAAAHTYLDGLQFLPDLKEWDRVAPRLAEVDAIGITRWRDFVALLVRDDAEAVAQLVQNLPGLNEGIDATRLAQIALDALNARGKADERGSTAAQESRAEALELLTVLAERENDRLPAAPLELTARELQVAELITSGLSNPRIAEVLVLSIRTVESHVSRLMRKTGARSRGDIRSLLLTSAE